MYEYLWLCSAKTVHDLSCVRHFTRCTGETVGWLF